MEDLHPDDRVPLLQVDPADAHGGAPHRPYVLLVEPDGHPVPRGEEDLVLARGDRRRDQLVPFVQAHRDDAARPRPGVLHELRLLDDPLRRRGHHVLPLHELADRQDRGDRLPRRQGQQVHDRAPLRGAAGLRELVDLHPVHLAGGGEEHDVGVHRGDEDVLDEILLLRPHPHLAPSPAPLRPVEADRIPLDVAGVGDGDHHLLVDDQVLEPDVLRLPHDLRAALVRVAFPDLPELVPDDPQELRLLGQDLLEPGDLRLDLLELLEDLLPLESGQPLQPHVEDRLRLEVGEPELPHQAVLGLPGVLRPPDELDDGVQVVKRDLQALEDVGPRLGLPEQEQGPSGHDLLAEREELLEHLLEGERARPVLDDRQELHAEGGLHLGLLVEVVQDHLGDGVLLQLDDHPHAVAVGLVPDVGDLLNLLFPNQVGDLLDQARLVHLIGDLGDDDRLAVPLLHLLDEGAGADLDAAPARPVGVAHPVQPVEDPARGEVGRRDALHELFDRDLGVRDEVEQGVEHFPEVVGRDGSGHPDGDPGAPVHQEGGDARRKDARLLEGAVVVGDGLDRVLVEVGQELPGDLRHPDLGVPHRGRRVAVHRAEVPLPVDQRVPQGKVLHHPHERVVDCVVPVGVVLADDVPDDAGGLLVRLAVLVPQFVHREEDTTLDRLEPVAHVGQRPPHDHAHRVIEVALLHFVLDGAPLRGTAKKVHRFSWLLSGQKSRENARNPYCSNRIC